MKTYLVGGAVRDKLLGLPVKDRDWVVTGSTPEQMVKLGYRPVGQDFPVFLHPKTNEEYALARTERKSGHGYSGFTFFTSPEITLEEDLQRRDLTINAMAEDEQGTIIDPYSGQRDLQHRILRHVAPAFREDPLRILRTARFYARFSHLGFTVAPETQVLMQAMVAEGEAGFLVPERVWQETVRALMEQSPENYFLALAETGALKAVMPELTTLWQSSATLSAKALQRAAKEHAEAEVRFACAIVDNSPNADTDTLNLCSRLKVPGQFKDVARLTAANLPHWLEGQLPSPEVRLSMLQSCDGFRRPERFQQILQACSLLAQARQVVTSLSAQLLADLENCKAVDVAALVAQGHKGKQLAEAIRQARLGSLS